MSRWLSLSFMMRFCRLSWEASHRNAHVAELISVKGSSRSISSLMSLCCFGSMSSSAGPVHAIEGCSVVEGDMVDCSIGVFCDIVGVDMWIDDWAQDYDSHTDRFWNLCDRRNGRDDRGTGGIEKVHRMTIS